MEIYLLKTEHNPYSSQLQGMVQMFDLGEAIVEEAFSPEGEEIRSAGVRAIPSLVAAYRDQDGVLRILHQTNTTQELPSFLATAQARYDEATA